MCVCARVLLHLRRCEQCAVCSIGCVWFDWFKHMQSSSCKSQAFTRYHGLGMKIASECCWLHSWTVVYFLLMAGRSLWTAAVHYLGPTSCLSLTNTRSWPTTAACCNSITTRAMWKVSSLLHTVTSRSPPVRVASWLQRWHVVTYAAELKPSLSMPLERILRHFLLGYTHLPVK